MSQTSSGGHRYTSGYTQRLRALRHRRYGAFGGLRRVQMSLCLHVSFKNATNRSSTRLNSTSPSASEGNVAFVALPRRTATGLAAANELNPRVKKGRSHADLCLRRPSSSPSSTWPLGSKSNSKDRQRRLAESQAREQTCGSITSWLSARGDLNPERLHHLVCARPVPPVGPGFHRPRAVKEDRSGWRKVTATVRVRVHVCSHDIGVRGVWQPQRPSVVLPIQLRLSRVQLVQAATDRPAFLQGLPVLRKLREKPDMTHTPGRFHRRFDRKLTLPSDAFSLLVCGERSGQPRPFTGLKHSEALTDHQSLDCEADSVLLLFQVGNLCSYRLELPPHTHL